MFALLAAPASMHLAPVDTILLPKLLGHTECTATIHVRSTTSQCSKNGNMIPASSTPALHCQSGGFSPTAVRSRDSPWTIRCKTGFGQQKALRLIHLLFRWQHANTSTAGLCPGDTDSSLQHNADAYKEISCNRDFCLLTRYGKGMFEWAIAQIPELENGIAVEFITEGNSSMSVSAAETLALCPFEKACSEAGTAP